MGEASGPGDRLARLTMRLANVAEAPRPASQSSPTVTRTPALPIFPEHPRRNPPPPAAPQPFKPPPLMDLPMAPSLPDVPPWQQHGAAQAQAAAEGGSSIIDEDGNVGFAVPAQVQVGKPESSWRCVGSSRPSCGSLWLLPL